MKSDGQEQMQETLRDRFAMAALTGFTSGPYELKNYEAVAAKAWRMAEAMLAARATKQEG